jgi:hypothetical protein
LFPINTLEAFYVDLQKNHTAYLLYRAHYYHIVSRRFS